MSLGYSDGDVPVGYVSPPFPSLLFNLSENPYTSALLFYAWDIYVFTVYWFLIFSIGMHFVIVSVIIAVNYKRNIANQATLLIIFLSYIVCGAFYGYVLGSFVGLLLGAIYRAGALHMSTWVPFTWALGVMMFTIFSSYEFSTIDM
ncbi:May24 protein [Starmerella bacillaris]|uniref:May24 protein n=1 Tax=Starmerella bacillaris TaxID=1247836 RepID=A0AAV5RQG2_STABA|nr:May24 protein [Starmerella bacillaris]